MQERLSEFIGKELTTKTGERAGHIYNVYTDAKLRRIRCFACFGEDEEEFFVPCRAVRLLDGEAVLKAAPLPACEGEGVPAPFGKRVYAADGTLLGTAVDFVREGTAIEALCLSDGRTLTTDKVVNALDAVLVNENKKPRARIAPAKKSAPALQEDGAQDKTAAAAQAEELRAAEGQEIRAGRTRTAQAEEKQPLPKAGSCLLTGKRLPRDLTDERGRVLAARGSLVTAETIRRALANKKLFELTLLCCGNAANRQ